MTVASPDAATRAALAGCDSEALHAAASGDADWARVRECAMIERDQGDERPFGGTSMLMTVYANGLGVARDFALARRFACESGGAPAEVEGRLAHLAEMEASDDPARRIDPCDDVTSGMMFGHCAERDARQAATARRVALDALLARWSAQDRAAWSTLRSAADAFMQARLEGEIDVSGTMRGVYIIGERESLENGLMAHLAAFERGELPDGEADELAIADARLNSAYATARDAAKPEGEGDDAFGPLGTITPDGIRSAERAWIRYRDAWTVFGTQRYPTVGADAWKTFFTRERTVQLEEIAGGDATP